MKGLLRCSHVVARLHVQATRTQHGCVSTGQRLLKRSATALKQQRLPNISRQPVYVPTDLIPASLTSVKTFATNQRKSPQPADYLDAKDKEIFQILSADMTVLPDFLSEEEEYSFLDEVERYMRRLRYEFDHWDNAIHGYRETEKSSWNEKNKEVIQRVQNLAFPKNASPLAHVHVLDLARDGYIKPHVDAVRFCGDTIAGMCLMSSCVMRLALEKDPSKYGDIHLPRRCLYIMKGRARYEFTHEVLKEEESIFRNQLVPRDRRISVICRSEPKPADTEFY